MTSLGNTDIRNRSTVGFAADHAGDDPCHIGPQSEYHQVEEQPVVILDTTLVDGSGETICLSRINFWLGHIEPGVGPFGSDFYLANGGQVLIQLVAVLATELAVDTPGVCQHGVQDTAPALQPATHSIFAFSFDSKQAIKNRADIPLSGNLDSITRPGQRMSFDCHFQRSVTSRLALDLGHHLIDRDGVAKRAAVGRHICASEPHLIAVVVFA